MPRPTPLTNRIAAAATFAARSQPSPRTSTILPCCAGCAGAGLIVVFVGAFESRVNVCRIIQLGLTLHTLHESTLQHRKPGRATGAHHPLPPGYRPSLAPGSATGPPSAPGRPTRARFITSTIYQGNRRHGWRNNRAKLASRYRQAQHAKAKVGSQSMQWKRKGIAF
jgi:hypothetical protein